jgi:dihydrofolate synthase/folylpolyglutamate synthase
MAQILFPLFDQVIFAPIHSTRAADLQDLQAAAKTIGTAASVAASVAEAIEWAKDRAQGGIVVISGSVYLVGEARPHLIGESAS